MTWVSTSSICFSGCAYLNLCIHFDYLFECPKHGYWMYSLSCMVLLVSDFMELDMTGLNVITIFFVLRLVLENCPWWINLTLGLNMPRPRICNVFFFFFFWARKNRLYETFAFVMWWMSEKFSFVLCFFDIVI
jgi:hypothetical protein